MRKLNVWYTFFIDVAILYTRDDGQALNFLLYFLTIVELWKTDGNKQKAIPAIAFSDKIKILIYIPLYQAQYQ